MQIDFFIENIDNDHVRRLTAATHEYLMELIPQVQATIKYGVPFYIYYKPICYLSPKKDFLVIGLHEGWQLSNAQGILQGNGKIVRHIHIREFKDIYTENVMQVLQEAIFINEKNYHERRK